MTKTFRDDVILSKAKDLAMYSAGFFATLKMTFIKVTLNTKL